MPDQNVSVLVTPISKVIFFYIYFQPPPSHICIYVYVFYLYITSACLICIVLVQNGETDFACVKKHEETTGWIELELIYSRFTSQIITKTMITL